MNALEENVPFETGCIYILVNSSMPGVLKIGFTERDVELRAAELSTATGVPVPFVVAYYTRCPDAERAEIEIHDILSKYRLNNSREFFRMDIREAISTLDEVSGRYHRFATDRHIDPNAESPVDREDRLAQEATDLLMKHGRVGPSMIASQSKITLNESEHIIAILQGRGFINKEWDAIGYMREQFEQRQRAEQKHAYVERMIEERRVWEQEKGLRAEDHEQLMRSLEEPAFDEPSFRKSRAPITPPKLLPTPKVNDGDSEKLLLFLNLIALIVCWMVFSLKSALWLLLGETICWSVYLFLL